MKQLYLRPRIGEPPILALRDTEPMPGDPGVPADLIELPGAVIEATSRFDKDSAMRACVCVAELCKAGTSALASVERLNEHVETATKLMHDLLAYIRGDTQLTQASAIALANGVLNELRRDIDEPVPAPEPAPAQPEKAAL